MRPSSWMVVLGLAVAVGSCAKRAPADSPAPPPAPPISTATADKKEAAPESVNGARDESGKAHGSVEVPPPPPPPPPPSAPPMPEPSAPPASEAEPGDRTTGRKTKGDDAGRIKLSRPEITGTKKKGKTAGKPGSGGGKPGRADGTTSYPSTFLPADETPSAPSRPAAPASGPVRAGSADDNLQFNAFLRFADDNASLGLRNDVSRRVIVRVTDKDGLPLPDAVVTASDRGKALVERRTYADGRTMLFPSELPALARQGTRLSVTWNGKHADAGAGWASHHTLEVRIPTSRGAFQQVPLDLAFVLDTTGSMGDEIDALKKTLDQINFQITNLSPRPDVRFGMVLFRDRGDDYVTQVVDFTPSLPQFQRRLASVEAGGGGDTPEDVQAGLDDAMHKLKWREKGVKLAFLIGDAAPHTDYGQGYTYLHAMRDAARRAIKIATIGASGLDKPAEVAWRQLAQYTMAPFVFLTFGEKGDSEGGTPSSVSHHIGSNWVAENLDAIIVRLVKTELAHYSKTGSPPREDFFEASRGKGPSDDVLSDLFRQSVQQLTDYCVHRLDDRTPTVVAGLAAPDAALGKLAGKLETQLQLGLSRARAFQLVEGAETNKLRQVLKTQSSLSYDETRMIALGKLVPAKLAVLSQLSRGAPGRLELVVKLVHLGSGEILSMSLLKIDESLLASR